MQLKIYNNENTYVVNGPVYVNETTKIWCGKISDGEFKGAFVKILNYGELDDKAAKNELKNVLREEVNTLKQVSKCSKRVPSVKDYWDDTRESRYVVIMDTMPGVSLRAWLDKHQRDELQAKDIFIRKCLVIQICEIMRDISNKYPVLVHRDLKPENIFVNFNKETKKWDIRAMIDTGNMLQDPVGQKPVHIISKKMAEKIYGAKMVEELMEYSLSKENEEKWMQKKLHFISCQTIQGTHLLPVITMDKMEIRQKSVIEIQMPQIGIGVMQETDYQMIVNAQSIGGAKYGCRDNKYTTV